MTIKNICIIPARGGSKRIKNKNIINFYNKPLIYWPLNIAKKCKIFDKIYVSTDSDKIINKIKKYKIDILKRSKINSNDKATLHDVIRETIHTLKLESNVNICCLLPTAVLVNQEKLKLGLKILQNNKNKFVVPIVKFSYPPQRGLYLKNKFIKMINNKNFRKNSQSFENIYHDAGQFIWGKSKSFLNINNPFNKKSIGIILNERKVQDIDSLEDLMLAKMKFKFR